MQILVFIFHLFGLWSRWNLSGACRIDVYVAALFGSKQLIVFIDWLHTTAEVFWVAQGQSYMRLMVNQLGPICKHTQAQREPNPLVFRWE